jgi:transposase-like protein
MGVLERHGPDGHSRVRTSHVPDTRRTTIEGAIRASVEQGANLYTDEFGSYRFLGVDDEYMHEAVSHAAEEYVRENVHTNGIENFWSLLKRSLGGTYVSVEPFHLFRYIDEQAFRFNNRKVTDGVRFLRAAAGIMGKRLTYAELTGLTPRQR